MNDGPNVGCQMVGRGGVGWPWVRRGLRLSSAKDRFEDDGEPKESGEQESLITTPSAGAGVSTQATDTDDKKEDKKEDKHWWECECAMFGVTVIYVIANLISIIPM